MMHSRQDVFADSRATFLKRTYSHLLMAIVAFTMFEVFLFQSGLAKPIASAMLGMNWLLILGGFMVVSWIASRAAHSAESLSTQYIALFAYVIANGLIFVPMLYIANHYVPGAIAQAAQVTLLGFSGLTLIAFYTRKNFSFLRGFLYWGGLCALGAIVVSVLFNNDLGIWFSVAMVAFAGAAILYDTSNIIHEFPEDRYVGAALQLFASVALLFWYVLRLIMALSSDDRLLKQRTFITVLQSARRYPF